MKCTLVDCVTTYMFIDVALGKLYTKRACLQSVADLILDPLESR